MLAAAIRATIIRLVALQGPPPSVHRPSALDSYMMNPSTRELAFLGLLAQIEEDSQRRGQFGEILLVYVVGFPPSDVILRKISEISGKHATSLPVCVFRELKKVSASQLQCNSLTNYAQRITIPVDFHHPTDALTSGVPQFVHLLPTFQPATRDAERGKTRSVNMSPNNPREAQAVAVEKNKLHKDGGRMRYCILRVKDYVDQSPLEISSEVLDQLIRNLGSYFDNFKTHSTVVRSTNAVLKLICDAFTRKIYLQTLFFREVSVAFLPIFLNMLDSEYFCVRNHVFDMLVTLSLHLQLVDTQDSIVGVTAALQNELVWMVTRVVQKMCVVPDGEKQLWTSALKCILIVLPRNRLPELDAQVLLTCLLVKVVSHCHPHIHTVLAEALAHKMLSVPPGSPRDANTLVDSSLVLTEEALLMHLGVNAVHRLVSVYQQSTTLSSRLHLFAILFSVAVGKRNPHVEPQQSLSRCFRFLVDVAMHWHFQVLVPYQPHSISKDLPQQLSLDMDVKEMRDIKLVVNSVVSTLIQLAASHRRLPEQLSTLLTSCSDDPKLTEEVTRSCLRMIPIMIKEDIDGTLRRTSVHLVVHLLRMLRPHEDDHDMPDGLGRQLMKTLSSSNSQKVRGVCVDVLAALGVLARTSPQQALLSFNILLKQYLTNETHLPHLMATYYVLVQLLTIPYSSLGTDGDLSALCAGGNLHVVHKAAEAVGSPALWTLYWGLRQNQIHSASRARFVLVSILASLELLGPPTTQIMLWAKVMTDSYPPAALIGAQKIIRISGVAQYDKYEAAISEAQRNENPSCLSNSYNMASSIWERVEAEIKR